VNLVPGVTWCVVGQPFDLVRVRLAAESPGAYRGAVDCLVKTLRAEGAGALWKGLPPSLLISLPHSCLLFSTYYAFRPKTPDTDDGYTAAFYAEVLRAGMLAGVPITLFQNPLDVWRVRSQMSRQLSGATVLGNLLKSAPPSIFMRGASLTAFRNIPCTGGYMVCYEAVTAYLNARKWFASETRALMAGGVVGLFYSLATHPLEVLRANVLNSDATSGGIVRVARKLWGEGGARRMYRGVLVSITKAVPVHAAGLWSLAVVKDLVETRRKENDSARPDLNVGNHGELRRSITMRAIAVPGTDVTMQRHLAGKLR